MAEHLAAALAAATAAAETAMQALAEVRRAQVQGLATKPKELELSGRPEEDRRCGRIGVLP
jgi:ABC-type transporter Mla subunit MlaD